MRGPCLQTPPLSPCRLLLLPVSFLPSATSWPKFYSWRCLKPSFPLSLFIFLWSFLFSAFFCFFNQPKLSFGLSGLLFFPFHATILGPCKCKRNIKSQTKEMTSGFKHMTRKRTSAARRTTAKCSRRSQESLRDSGGALRESRVERVVRVDAGQMRRRRIRRNASVPVDRVSAAYCRVSFFTRIREMFEKHTSRLATTQ